MFFLRVCWILSSEETRSPENIPESLGQAISLGHLGLETWTNGRGHLEPGWFRPVPESLLENFRVSDSLSNSGGSRDTAKTENACNDRASRPVY
jgi:hypothetical protein